MSQPATKLGLSSFAYAWSIGVPGYAQPRQRMDAFEFVRRCSDLGVRVAQFGDNLPLHELSDGELDALQTELARRGLTPEIGTRGIGHDHLRRYLDLAVHFDAKLLRVVMDTDDHRPGSTEIVATLRGIMPAFQSADIILAVENHDRLRARQLADIIEQVGGEHIGVCLDTVNSFGALEGPEVVVETLAPHVVNLHVKDFVIARAGHNMGFEVQGAPAGAGMLNIPWLLARLDRCVRGYNAVIELWPPPQADIEATCAKEQAWAQESVAYLRKWIKD